MALKLGHDLWVWAREYPAVYELLDAAYEAEAVAESRERLAHLVRGDVEVRRAARVNGLFFYRVAIPGR